MTELLKQWKDISKYLGIPVGTIRHWHYKVLPLPYRKSVPRRSGRVVEKEGLRMGTIEFKPLFLNAFLQVQF